MANVIIGHASIDENGKAKNGKSGDQTGKEVCTRTWYNKPWDCVLRPINSTIAEKSAVACEQGCANNNIGYDQNQRNTLHTEAKKVNYDLSKIKTGCETDCSAFMTVCAIAGGVAELEYTGNAPTTSTMKSKFVATKKYTALTDTKYTTKQDFLKRGDILVKAGSHTVMVLSDGACAVGNYYPQYKGFSVSIVTALKEVGERDTSIANRKKIALANGITGYAGTATQNTKMLTLLKKGQLLKG